MLLAILLASAWLWLYRRNWVHLEFGPIHVAEISESYADTQSVLRQGEALVRQWLRLPPRQWQSKEGYDVGLPIGPAVLGWSMRNNRPPRRDGYIYMVDPRPKAGDAPLWEFALNPKRRLRDVTREELNCEFYGKNDPRGTNAFGTNYTGRTLIVPEGQVFLARLVTNRAMVYAVRLASQGGSPSRGTMRAEFVEVKGQP